MKVWRSGTVVYMSAQPREMSVTDSRREYAEVLNAAARGEITYIMSRGRRVAAVVPVPVAEASERSAPDLHQ